MVAVVSKTGEPLMPTSPYRARKLLKKQKAKIYRYRPFFTIQLLERETGYVQDVEYKSDTGYSHVGISICSSKHELLAEQRDLLEGESERHNDRRKYRRTRRNRKRYRKARFENRIHNVRKREKEGRLYLAPTLQHKLDAQLYLFREACKVFPIKRAYFEIGKFDPALMKALEAGLPAPEGVDYQRGERYQIATRRAAVFARDHHTCVFCGRGIPEKAILHVHHLGFWKGDRTNRLSNLVTCCEQCHTPENHKPGGKLYGQEPKLLNMASAAYMNAVRYELVKQAKNTNPDVLYQVSYGSRTAVIRKTREIPKSHINDAYCLGTFYPKHRATPEYYKKVRRNDRILQRFYDAVYLDSRDGSQKKGSQLTNGRINRNHKRDHEDLHPFRQKKLKKGRITVRRSRIPIKPGSLVELQGEILVVHGLHNSTYRSKKTGTVTKTVNVEFETPAKGGQKSAALSKCKVIQKSYNTGWEKYKKEDAGTE